MRMLLYRHLVDEVPDVPWMRDHRSDGVVGLWDDGTLVHPADAGWFADDVLQGVGLLQLAQVVVLHSDSDVSIPDFRGVCVCVSVWAGVCVLGVSPDPLLLPPLRRI